MTEEEKLIKHTEDLINAFNDSYKDYRNSVIADKGRKSLWCRVLAGCAFGLAKDFSELEKLHDKEVAE
jgi:hypothetical protein